MRTYRHTIRIFYELKNGAVRILHTDPVYVPVGKEGGKGAESSIEPGAKKAEQNQIPDRVD